MDLSLLLPCASLAARAAILALVASDAAGPATSSNSGETSGHPVERSTYGLDFTYHRSPRAGHTLVGVADRNPATPPAE